MAHPNPDPLSSSYLKDPSLSPTITRQATRRLILGLGNPLRGDDGVGSAIITRLTKQIELPASVDLIDGGIAGMKILTMLEGYDHVILVDAADLGLSCGEWLRLDLDELLRSSIVPDKKGTLHEAGVVDALAVGRAMNMLPLNVSIYVIQAQDIHGVAGMSSSVRESIPAICDAILSEIGTSC
jgi:hydrogenase maturation protease